MKYNKKDVIEQRISFKPMSIEKIVKLGKYFNISNIHFDTNVYHRFYYVYDKKMKKYGSHPSSYLNNKDGYIRSNKEISFEDFDFEEEFVLPEKWYCIVTNENYEILNNWRKIKCGDDFIDNYIGLGYAIASYCHFDSSFYYTKNHISYIPKLYIEITTEQFKKYVLKEKNNMKLPNSNFAIVINDNATEILNLLGDNGFDTNGYGGGIKNGYYYTNTDNKIHFFSGTNFEEKYLGHVYIIFTLDELKQKFGSIIVGYKVPYDLWGGDIPKDSIYIPSLSSPDNYSYKDNMDSDYNIASEIVTTWEPVYQEEINKTEEIIVRMGGENGFDLKVRNHKIFHTHEDITSYVNDIYEDFKGFRIKENYSNNHRITGYDFIATDMIISKTGCENKETKLSEWLNLYTKYVNPTPGNDTI